MKTKTYGPVATVLLQAWLPIALVALWFVASAASTSAFWPSLATILQTVVDWAASGQLWGDLLFSFGNYFAALALAILVGLGFGLAIGLLPYVGEVLSPYLDFFRTLPIVVFVPIVILVLGVGRGPKVFLIFLACVWPILLNCIEGVRSIAPSVFETARGYRIPLGLRIRRVVLPGAAPQIAVGIRLAVTIGLVMLVVSEMYGSTEGVGYFILQSGQRFQLAAAWGGTLLVGVIGWAFTVVYVLIEHRVLAWTREDADASRRVRSSERRSK
ncbi:ABC transporter permease [Microbacterium sp. zg.B48]|uniref:ABC transporter permease n=1 Tax=Microbacterium sp. zg.B48 TaxID=2969408 RepID=UPI00214C7C61|nr:ABC transporter permease [Microbacterium sp. zg.B48]MCR2764458.1 ABC transporter permease [Microbacterium sp. zg.B48]